MHGGLYHALDLGFLISIDKLSSFQFIVVRTINYVVSSTSISISIAPYNITLNFDFTITKNLIIAKMIVNNN